MSDLVKKIAEPFTRIIPGAPPAASLSKTQKRKRKAKSKAVDDDAVSIPDAKSAALTEKAPEASEVREGAIAPELISDQDALKNSHSSEDFSLKPSPIVELVNKRLKATSKKISRINVYSATDPSKLNDDQKATLKTLPALEAAQKELQEVKKAVEVHEAELAQQVVVHRMEAAEAERNKAAELLTLAHNNNISKTLNLLTLLRLHTLRLDTTPQALNINNAEDSAISDIYEVLLGDDEHSKKVILDGMLSELGDYDGTSFSRLLEIAELYRHPTSQRNADEECAAQSISDAPIADEAGQTPPVVVPTTLPITGNFHFMQASELDNLEGQMEWANQAEATVNGDTLLQQPENLPAVVSQTNLEAVTSVGHGNEPIDWADDEGGLPSITGLQEKFGTPGATTPREEVTETDRDSSAANGHTEDPVPREQDDGFTQARGGRGRGRGGFRGTDRGHYRGLRGADRGTYRGSDRGFRGGPRGAPRGRPVSGEWRGGYEGDMRGRGRGRTGHTSRAPVAATS